jgi:dTDP-4-amino-4,6-dideoxygalactose transaminase
VRALLAGARAAIGSRNGHEAERVVGLLYERYAPRDVLLTESGTAALIAALRAILENRPSAPIAIPAYACYDLATVANGAGASAFLYDVDPHTLAPDLAQIEAALRAGAAAVVVAHLYGYPVDVREVSRLAAETGAVVIEDAAQAAGATLHGRRAGSWGSLSVLSFSRGKGLTGGSGGALMARDEAGARVLQRARMLLGEPRRGWKELIAVAAQLLLEHPSVYAIPAALPFLRLGETIYREPGPLRAPAVAANAMIAATWTLADHEVQLRRRNAERLLEAVQGQPDLAPIRAAAGAQPGYLRLPVFASPAARRAATERGARRLGIMPGYPKALCDLDRFTASCVNREATWPGARALANRLCTLPTHSGLDGDDFEGLESWIRTCASGVRDEHARRA